MTAFILTREDGGPDKSFSEGIEAYRAGKGYQARATCRAECGPPEAGLPARGDDESPPRRAALPSREGRGRMERPRPRPVPRGPRPSGRRPHLLAGNARRAVSRVRDERRASDP